ncbi:MAG: hypothetical protein EOM07_09970 [Clostridia bacterium]|nr:hypothetical protein [Anaerostipes sp.]NCB94445.1 hypothetical protein [Clostridia bacterium]NCC79911.1 hypothetical protein [Clostridia bacterium]
MDWTGRIKALHCIPQKRHAALSLETCSVTIEEGLKGDYHCAEGDTDLILWSAEIREQLEAEHFSGICFGRFQEHISVEGMELSALRAGDILRAGEARLKVSERRKKCHPDICEVENKKDCLMKRECVYVRIIAPGELTVGMKIEKEEVS